jgi:hypothetical protein
MAARAQRLESAATSAKILLSAVGDSGSRLGFARSGLGAGCFVAVWCLGEDTIRGTWWFGVFSASIEFEGSDLWDFNFDEYSNWGFDVLASSKIEWAPILIGESCFTHFWNRPSRLEIRLAPDVKDPWTMLLAV